MFSRRSALRDLGLVTLTIAGALFGCAAGRTLPPSAPSPLLGKALPSFKRPTLTQGEFNVDAVRGRIVVVKFFAEYCVPCQRTLPSAEQLYREHGDLAFVGVSEDERAADAERQVNRYGLSFPVVLDRGNVLAGRFRVRDLPVVFVGDRQGKVVWVGGPAQNENDLRAAIEAVRGGE